MSYTAVKLENVSKFYKLYNNPKDRLKEALHPFHKKYHREFFALKNITLEIQKGEILGIVGRNGAGKSTLLKLISGIIQPSAGSLRVSGSVSALLELGSGLSPDFTGLQNIYFYGTMLGFSREEMRKKCDDIIDFAEIGDFINQPLKTYSSGMKARLGFALAININPTILIIDEVLAVGDELFRRKCFAEMENLFKSGCTVLYVSHSASTVNEICSRAILLDKGEFILDGPPKLVTTYYQKLLYSRAENQNQTRDEIIQLNKNEELKHTYAGEQEVEADSDSPVDLIALEDREFTHEINDEFQQKPSFLPHLKPKSTLEYKNYDVEIFDSHIRTVDGERVNSLVIGDDYIYSFRVKFNTSAEKIVFGMKIKTIKGLEIGGACVPGLPGKGKTLKFVKRGDEYQVDWKFNCVLMPGSYYTNAGVYGIVKDYEGYLNRLTDSMVFLVQDQPERDFMGILRVYKTSRIIKL